MNTDSVSGRRPSNRNEATTGLLFSAKCGNHVYSIMQYGTRKALSTTGDTCKPRLNMTVGRCKTPVQHASIAGEV